jgi:hypothetical protein
MCDQIDAGARFFGEFRNYLPIQSAFWLKEREDGEWSLYVAYDQITDDNFDIAYGEARSPRIERYRTLGTAGVLRFGRPELIGKSIAF